MLCKINYHKHSTHNIHLSVEAEFDIGGVLLTLTLSILVPVILGKLMQCIPKVPEAVAKVKRWISVVTSSCLAVMLWMKV